MFERVRFATVSWSIGRLVSGATFGGGEWFTIGGSTLGSDRLCNGDVCTLGGGRGGIGRTGGLDTLRDRRKRNDFRGAIGSGRFSGIPGDAHRWHASRKSVTALSWASYTVMGVFFDGSCERINSVKDVIGRSDC